MAKSLRLECSVRERKALSQAITPAPIHTPS